MFQKPLWGSRDGAQVDVAVVVTVVCLKISTQSGAKRRVAKRPWGNSQRGPTWEFFCGFIVDSFKLVYNGLSTVGIMMDISFIFVYNVYSR